MIFDFDKFAQITASVYPVSPYTLEESLSVFRYYFEKYEEYTGRPHPPIRASQIVRICQDMPFISREYSGGVYADIEPEAYPALIDRYFAMEAMAQGSREPINVNLVVDGKTLARVVVPNINNMTRAAGKPVLLY